MCAVGTLWVRITCGWTLVLLSVHSCAESCCCAHACANSCSCTFFHRSGCVPGNGTAGSCASPASSLRTGRHTVLQGGHPPPAAHSFTAKVHLLVSRWHKDSLRCVPRAPAMRLASWSPSPPCIPTGRPRMWRRRARQQQGPPGLLGHHGAFPAGLCPRRQGPC